MYHKLGQNVQESFFFPDFRTGGALTSAAEVDRESCRCLAELKALRRPKSGFFTLLSKVALCQTKGLFRGDQTDFDRVSVQCAGDRRIPSGLLVQRVKHSSARAR